MSKFKKIIIQKEVEIVTNDENYILEIGDIIQINNKRTRRFCEMSDYRQDETGLPMIVFVSPRGFAKEPNPRIKVQQDYSEKWTSNTVNVDIETFEIAGTWKLKTKDFDLVKKWIELNKELIQFYWDNKINTEMFNFQKKNI